MKILRKQTGDTLVEVLLSVAVISLVLSLSYALANRSSQATRRAQERSEALKLAESQVEQLKKYLANSDANFPNNSCFGASGSLTSGTACNLGDGGRYNMNITETSNRYTVRAEWDRVGGGQVKDVISIVYSLPDITGAPQGP